MRAAVYRGSSVVSVDEILTPAIGDGEVLIRVEACGVCHTDLKKIEYDLLTPPRMCDGAGSCKTVTSTLCDPWGCGTTGTCRTT